MTVLTKRTRRGLKMWGLGALAGGLLLPTVMVLPAAAHSVGAYPTQLVYRSALRGGTYDQTIGILDDSPTPETFALTITGPIAAWSSFRDAKDPNKKITSAQAQAGPPTQVLLRVQVPVQASDDQYQGLVHLTPTAPAPTKGGTSGQGANISGEIPVGVQVTGTQTVGGTLLDAYTTPAIEVGYPARLFTVLTNTGNVEIHPAIHVTVARGSAVEFDHVFADEPLDPSPGSKKVESDWTDTTAAPIGSYVAHVEVKYLGQDVGSRDVRFQVVPYGSLRRQGTLDQLVLGNQPKPGEAAIVQATFHNTGQIETRPVFHGQLSLNGHVIAGVNSVPILTGPGDTQIVSMVIGALKLGHYTLAGRANFDGKESNARSLDFRVGTGGSSGHGLRFLLLGVVVMLLLTGGGVWFRRSRRNVDDARGDGPSARTSPKSLTPIRRSEELTPVLVGAGSGGDETLSDAPDAIESSGAIGRHFKRDAAVPSERVGGSAAG
jgi:hypothetical protein